MTANDLAVRRERRRSRGLSAAALKGWSAGAAAVIFLGSLGYASAHVYSASAPLQPVVADASTVARTATASTTTASGTPLRRSTSSFAGVTTTTPSAITRSHSS